MLFCIGKLKAEIELSSIFFPPEVGVKKLSYIDIIILYNLQPYSLQSLG